MAACWKSTARLTRSAWTTDARTPRQPAHPVPVWLADAHLPAAALIPGVPPGPRREPPAATPASAAARRTPRGAIGHDQGRHHRHPAGKQSCRTRPVARPGRRGPPTRQLAPVPNSAERGSSSQHSASATAAASREGSPSPTTTGLRHQAAAACPPVTQQHHQRTLLRWTFTITKRGFFFA